MGAAGLDINIEQGASFSLLLTFKDSSGATIDLTGWTFSGKIKEDFQSGIPTLASFTCTLANQVTNEGEMTISLTSAQTASFPTKKINSNQRSLTQYFYDLEVIKPDTTVDRVIEGKAFVSPEVSK